MIGIRINREHWLHLYADTKLDITLTSPVFSDKVIEENSVYNFTIPNNPHNAGVLGFPGRAQRMDRAQVSFDAEIFHNGKFVKRGAAIIRKTTRKDIEMVIGVDASSFYSIVNKKKITEFSYGGTLTYNGKVSGEIGSVYGVPNSVWPAVPFAYFPVYNESLYDGSELESAYKVSGFDAEGLYGVISSNLVRPYQNDYMTVSFTPDMDTNIGNRMSVTPFPYIGTVIKGIFEESGYSIVRNDILDDADLCRVCIYNPNISPFYVQSLVTYFDIRLNEHLPDMLVGDFLLAMKQTFGMNFVINEAMKTVEIIIYKRMRDDRTQISYFFDGDDLTTGKKIKYKPTADSSDAFSSDWIKPDEIEKHTIRTAVINQAQLAGIANKRKGDICLVQEENFFYLYDQDDTEAFVWSKFAYNIQSVTFGNEDDDEETVDAPFTGTFNEEKTMEYLSILGFDPDTWWVPRVDMPGNIRNGSMIPTDQYKDFDLKLMVYYGFTTTDTAGNPYPTGSTSICKGLETSLITSTPTPTLSLYPNQVHDYVNKYLTEFNRVLNNKRVRTIRRRMTVSEISSIDFMNTVLLDGCRWLINKASFSLSHEGVSIVEMELVQV